MCISKKELIKVCFQCEQKDIILDSGVCPSCDELNRKNDYLQNDGTVVITKDNIHLYYEFMSNKDLLNYKDILHDIFTKRIYDISNILNLSKVILSKKAASNRTTIRSSFFGVKDTLKPVKEYISEIKANSKYKEYIS